MTTHKAIILNLKELALLRWLVKDADRLLPLTRRQLMTTLSALKRKLKK